MAHIVARRGQLARGNGHRACRCRSRTCSKSVLVANRGEIAVRICRTLRHDGHPLGGRCIDPDRHSLAVRTADEWVLLEGYSAAESYLDIDAVIAAAKAQGLRGDPSRLRVPQRTRGLRRAAARRRASSSSARRRRCCGAWATRRPARQLAVANGVPVVPGWDGADDDETLLREAERSATR